MAGKVVVDSRHGSFELGNSDAIRCPSSLQTTSSSACFAVTRPAPLAVPNQALAAALTFAGGAPWLVALVADDRMSCTAQTFCSELPQCLCQISPGSSYSSWRLVLVPLATPTATRTLALSAPSDTFAKIAASSTEDGRLVVALGWQTYAGGMFDQAVLNIVFVAP
jgi:hypothetical protein